MGTYGGKPSKIVKEMTEDEIRSELPKKGGDFRDYHKEMIETLARPVNSEYANLDRKRTNGDMTSSSPSTEGKKGFDGGSTYKPN